MKKNKRPYNGPWHTHDCETCTYLGSEILKGKQYDFYIHIDECPTIIARYGAYGKYTSGTSFIFSHPLLNVALKKVFEQNISMPAFYRDRIRGMHIEFLVDRDGYFSSTYDRFKRLEVERFVPEDRLAVVLAQKEIAHQLKCAELLGPKK